MLENQTENINIRKAILSTVVFYDIFDYPPTSFEIWKFLFKKNAQFLEIDQELLKMVEKNILGYDDGYYFLFGRDEIIKIRHKRFAIAQRKYKTALFVGRFLSHIPFISMICVCNSLSFSNARDQSDIDFFIVCRNGRIWLTRILSIIITQFLGKRLHSSNTKDKICLSFFITDDTYDLQSLFYENDIYFYFWVANLYPLYSTRDSFEKFWEKNIWIKYYFPHIYPKTQAYQRRVASMLKKDRETTRGRIMTTIGNFCERMARNIQLPRVLHYTAESSGRKDSNTVISENILKLHVNDRRKKYRDAWIQKLSTLLNPPSSRLGGTTKDESLV